MNIKDEHLKEVCGFGSGAKTCGYLTVDAVSFKCAKGTKYEHDISLYQARNQLIPMGDNCSGSPDFIPTKKEPS